MTMGVDHESCFPLERPACSPVTGFNVCVFAIFFFLTSFGRFKEPSAAMRGGQSGGADLPPNKWFLLPLLWDGSKSGGLEGNL